MDKYVQAKKLPKTGERTTSKAQTEWSPKLRQSRGSCVRPPSRMEKPHRIWGIRWRTHKGIISAVEKNDLWMRDYFGLSLLFSQSVMSHCLWPHGLQHLRLPYPSPTPGACSNSCPLIQWCHPTISSSVVPFSSCPQSFSTSGSFLMSQLFASDGKSIGASASESALPMNIQDWFPLGLTGLISLQSKGFSRVSPTPYFKTINSLVLSLL